MRLAKFRVTDFRPVSDSWKVEIAKAAKAGLRQVKETELVERWVALFNRFDT
jgi:hypothetical protein